MSMDAYFEKPIIDKAWSSQKRLHWYFDMLAKGQQRDYQKDVVSRLKKLPNDKMRLIQYGHLTEDGAQYPLYYVQIGEPKNGKPNILYTAGVHGYEPSSIEAALHFLENDVESYSEESNLRIYPCISPWAYEFNHRWNAFAHDPNRLFSKNKEWADECRWFMQSLEVSKFKFDIALDGHETPDRDVDLRKSRASRYGTKLEDYWRDVPQGSYLMISTPKKNISRLRMAFGDAIIDAIAHTSPIAPEEMVLGSLNLNGVTVSKPVEGTMRWYLERHAAHVGITEIYPDHHEMGKDKAIQTQLAALKSGINFAHRIR